MPRFSLLTTLVLCWGLGACTNPPAQPEVHPLASEKKALFQSLSLGAVETFQSDVTVTVTIRVAGLPDQSSTPLSAIRSTLLLEPTGVPDVLNTRTRVDLPASSFPDGQARQAFFNRASGNAVVKFASSGAVDSTVNGSSLAQALSTASDPGRGFTSSGAAFRSESLSSFQNRLGSASFSSQSVGGQTLNAASTDTTSNGIRTQSTLFFNASLGTVTRIQQVASQASTVQDVTSDITFVSVAQGVETINIPTLVVTSGTTTTDKGTVNYTVRTEYSNPRINAPGVVDEVLAGGI